jgi:mannose-6-phosphate isomerase
LTSSVSSISRLGSTAFEKVWGSPLTEPWYRNPQHLKIGEVWFAASPAVPLLVKILFTSERLSVQVHPDDEYGWKHENSRGKTEMWHILRAEPEARIATGLLEPVTRDQLKAACLSGAVVGMLDWVPARKGDTFFIPAGTIHAIGGGVTLCEVQELSDVTYRLYDYGRPRELHLERGLEVSLLSPRDARAGRDDVLVECEHFLTTRLDVRGAADCKALAKNSLYIALEGEGTIGGAGFAPGDGFEVAAGAGRFEIISPAAAFLITSEP